MTDSPLTPMVSALQALLSEQQAVDQREVDGSGEHFRTPGQRAIRVEAIDHLEQAMSCVPANTAADAVVQVLIATGRTQSLQQETCERPLSDELEVVHRLLRSALPVLAHHAGFDLTAFGAAYYGLAEPRPADAGSSKA